MRREHELAGGEPQDLRDFRRVTMRSHPVGFDAFVRETEVRALGGLLARAGDARERVDDDSGALFDEPGAQKRRSGKRGRRGIAARAGHEHSFPCRSTRRGRGELVARELRQTEGSLCEKVGGSVRHLVPLLVDCGVFQAVVGGQVDDRGARGDEFWRHREGRRVRDGEEGHVEVGKHALIVLGEDEVARTRERGVHLGERAPGERV